MSMEARQKNMTTITPFHTTYKSFCRRMGQRPQGELGAVKTGNGDIFEGQLRET